MAENQAMIEVADLKKSYGGIQALDGVTFEVRKGEVLGFLGPNGAGKTTTMKILTCFIAPTAGRVKVAGTDIHVDPLEVRRHVGYLPENAPLYGDMRVDEYLDFVAEVRQLGSDRKRAQKARVVELCAIGDVVGQEIRTLSKGYRQRVGLAQAMIHDPPILILDEPTSGLDPNQIVEIRELIKSLGEERTVILSTHHLAEVQAAAQRVVIIHQGRLVADGRPADLEKRRGGNRCELVLRRPDGGDAPVRERLASLAGVRQVEVVGSVGDELALSVEADGEADLRADLFRAVVDGGWVMLGLTQARVDLEAIFRRLTTEDKGAASGKEVA